MLPNSQNGIKPRISVISVCSGIGTDAVAWQPLGWKHLCFAEIEKFPSAVLAHHWPHVINRGDFTKIGDEYRGAADLLVGGTPCQSFSVAGLRGGLADDRGNLALEFLRLADRTRPRWVVWENVPGVLSSDGGRDFGSILGGLGKLGYGWAYRILDAQYFGVPQRRRRVFVVGCLGDWRRAAAVLFERHSLQGNHPPSREKGQGFTHELAPGIGASGRGFERAGETRGQDPVVAEELCRPFAMDAMLDRHLSTDATVTDHLSPGSQLDCSASAKSAKSQARKNSLSSKSRLNPEVSGAVSSKWAKGTGGPSGDECYNLVAHPLRGDGFDASEDGTGRGTPLIAAALKANSGRNKIESQYLAIRTAQTSVNGHGVAEDVAHTLDGAQGQAVCFHENQRAEVTLNDTAGSLKVGGGKPGQGYPAVQSGMAVRRLTPRECERLQGLPDDFTLVPFNGKTASDGPRYKAIGNGMAMPVLRWIGERIAAVEGAL